MGDKSKIEWTDATWNPIRARNLATGQVGSHCEKVSPACDYCYAERLNLSGIYGKGGTRLPYAKESRSQVEIFLHEETLLKPLAWKRPRKIFPCSMTDLFAGFVPDEWILKMFGIMAYCRRHTFQVLTKRSKRMHDLLSRVALSDCLNAAGLAPDFDPVWPLSNVWLGVTAEDQGRFNRRVEDLVMTPAVVRFVSCEPLLGIINPQTPILSPLRVRKGQLPIDLIIAGGESGKEARPTAPYAVYLLRDWCVPRGVAFHFKQWGEWAPWDFDNWNIADYIEKHIYHKFSGGGQLCESVYRVGKKIAGRKLAGREWNELPELAHA